MPVARAGAPTGNLVQAIGTAQLCVPSHSGCERRKSSSELSVLRS
jgi:hypothetical protein